MTQATYAKCVNFNSSLRWTLDLWTEIMVTAEDCFQRDTVPQDRQKFHKIVSVNSDIIIRM